MSGCAHIIEKMIRLNRNVCWHVWCAWCGWHDWSWCNSDKSIQCSAGACVISHVNVFLSQWAWWNCQKLSRSSGKVGRISHLNCIHMILFDMIGIRAIVMGWRGYYEKVYVHTHVKQFDRTRLGTKVAGISSYSILLLLFFFFLGMTWCPL